MQLPTVERTPNLRPSGADAAVPAAARVIPVAPVNPAQHVQESVGVVNNINPQVQAQAGAVDPLQGGSQADNSGRGWTQSKGAPVSLEEAPKEPLSKMLLEQIHLVWSASARVVEIWLMNNPAQNQAQIQNLAQSRNQVPTAIPGVLAKEALTYSPSKIKKTEKPE